MDALFGLPRKKSAGTSYREPLLKDVFFNDQSLVDEFVADSGETKTNLSVSFHLYKQLC